MFSYFSYKAQKYLGMILSRLDWALLHELAIKEMSQSHTHRQTKWLSQGSHILLCIRLATHTGRHILEQSLSVSEVTDCDGQEMWPSKSSFHVWFVTTDIYDQLPCAFPDFPNMMDGIFKLWAQSNSIFL